MIMKKITDTRFIIDSLDSMVIASDEELMNRYISKYLKKCILFWNWSAIAKKWESLRKKLSLLRQKGILLEDHRINRDKSVSCEIFYKKA